MNPKYDIYEQIDRYLNKELSEAELAQFNERLSHDAEFKSIVEAQKIANEVIIDQEMIKLKARMKQEMNADPAGSGPWAKIIILSAVVTSAALLYTYLNHSSSSTEETKSVVASSSSEHPAPIEENKKAKEYLSKPIQSQKVSSHSDAPTSISSVPATPPGESKPEEVELKKEHAVSPLATKTEEVKQAAQTIEPLKVNCEVVVITAKANIDYSSSEKGEATIVIEQASVKGGSAPYTYALNQSAFEQDPRFEGLKDGVYHVRIKDYNGCISPIKKELVVKIPLKEIDEAFVPSQGERWKFPVKTEADATLTIFNKSGATVYSTTISGGYPEEWDGRTNAGVELESGNYYFVIQYSARDIVKGHISIVK